MTSLSPTERASSSSGGAMRLVAEPGALRRLGALVDELAPSGEVVLVTDGVPKTFSGGDVDAAVAAAVSPGRPRRTVRVPSGSHGVTLDEATVDAVTADATGAAVVVTVGSGTVSDLGKVVAAALEVPLVAVQTAASVNGFADPLSVLVRKGAKRTVPSRWPDILLIDHDIVADAPSELTRAGVGDAVAIWSSPADWYLACALGMDDGRYDGRFVDPVRDLAPRLSDASSTAADRLSALVDVLTVGGLVIGDAGTTAPLSGVEHLFSHVLDMSALAEGAAHDLHGAQVGVASILSAALWDVALTDERVFDLDPDDLAVPADLEERVRAVWHPVDPSGALGDECWRAVDAKMRRWGAAAPAIEDFFGRRNEHVTTLRALAADPALPVAALRAWGAPSTFAQLRPAVSAERARWALSALPFMRDRLTLADVLVLAGRWDDGLFDRVLARADRAVGSVATS
ncbi:iron-containing alcohol dehydrogenase [Microbacterium sp. IEGM 1404]|uniref:iron-containing alcohol dehydrogenase n=1 Tax=Microbacterium sp. IEGM 1404 TaxID=3047084 RepID=UPI0024B854D3|nr:iron-containing alcohol dehydrogenase [Microbacterium sp. IEGM 1404]MDI9891111.1 iron-containing alcohol dehydrogenase [Microbacterium sp. IEGM 1404]